MIINKLIFLFYLFAYVIYGLSADNVCTFHIADKLFTLKYIQQKTPY